MLKEAKQNSYWLILQEDSTSRPWDLDDWYKSVSDIRLDDTVPERVKHYFDVAKNILLYSWFSYEMMPSAELFSYTMVEKALRIKYDCENSHRPTFSTLLRRAVDEGLLNDSGFHIPRNSVKRNICFKNDELVVECDKKTHEELKACQDYIKPICNLVPMARNLLAHGKTYLHPGGQQTLKINSEIINMLFKK